jgi:hypothetical protein
MKTYYITRNFDSTPVNEYDTEKEARAGFEREIKRDNHCAFAIWHNGEIIEEYLGGHERSKVKVYQIIAGTALFSSHATLDGAEVVARQYSKGAKETFSIWHNGDLLARYENGEIMYSATFGDYDDEYEKEFHPITGDHWSEADESDWR